MVKHIAPNAMPRVCSLVGATSVVAAVPGTA